VNDPRQIKANPPRAGSSVAVGFVLGALVGAAIGLLLAPGTGTETRRRLAQAGGRLSDAARDALDEARGAANELAQDAKSALETARRDVERGAKSHEPRTTAGADPSG